MTKWLSDTLFKRLFFLMWVALVVSHFAGYLSSHYFSDSFAPPHDWPLGAGDAPRLWLDYLARLLVIGGAAWWGARWLSRPMHRLAEASRALTRALPDHQRPTPLNEAGGTLEVQQTAEVFNAMASQLHEQFEAQGLMMAAISHDLRTPLARLRLRLEQMEPGPLQARCAADVQEADRLIADVLATLRLSHQPVPPQRVDLHSLLRAMVDDLVEQGEPVSCDLPPPAQPAQVWADASALQRVVGNLMGNALRHGGATRVMLSEEGGRLRVCIDDDGPGIPEAELQTVFLPFHRLGTGNEAGQGSGLGLYIARDLTRRLSGSLTLQNRAEGGLRAELSLPRATA